MYNLKRFCWMPYLCALLLALCAGAEDAQAQCSSHYTFTGEAAGDYFGVSVSGAGDVDNDGYADLIVGAHVYDVAGTYAGQADVYSGRTGGLLWTFTGEAEGDYFGRSVSGAGDVDNDGYADLIAGAYANDAGGDRAGRAYVYSGQTGGLLWTFTGEAAGDGFGWSVSGAGDVDNDGYADLIVGAYRNDAGGGDAGRAYVYSGRTGALLWTFTGEAIWDFFGRAVSGAGDIDNDGYADLIVGAYHNAAGGDRAGRAYVYSGRTGVLLWTFTGEAELDYFGWSVSGAGDVDNDGYADLIVGAYQNDAGGARAGRAYVYSGRTGGPLWTFTGEAVNDYFGFSVSGAGDVDSDGYADLIVGAHVLDAARTYAGQAYVYSGRTGVLLQTFAGEAAGDRFGYSVSGVGDVDADGYADLIVGAPYNNAGGPEAGRAYVYTCVYLSAIAGRVTADCPSANTGLLGVPIDAFELGSGDLVGTTVTDGDGKYDIYNLAPGDYTVSIITPLSYNAATDEIVVTVTGGNIATADFALTCSEIIGASPNGGFWKHQIGVAISGNGNAQIDAASVCDFLDLIADRFNGNQINPVVIYVPPASGECADKLLVAKDLLNLRGNVGMTARAKQQLMMLLMNVAAGNMSLTAIISDDGATVSQAITYCDNLIDDPAGDHETAKTICDDINNNRQVASGVIPLTTQNIAYKTTAVPNDFSLNQNFPNPFNASTMISFVLDQDGPVRLEVFDILGRRVAVLVDGFLSTGIHQVYWNGNNLDDRPVGSGIYFYRLMSGADTQTRKMVLMK